MTECSKPLDLVKNRIFFVAAVAVETVAARATTAVSTARNRNFMGVELMNATLATGEWFVSKFPSPPIRTRNQRAKPDRL
jgi:hypothetical protein